MAGYVTLSDGLADVPIAFDGGELLGVKLAEGEKFPQKAHMPVRIMLPAGVTNNPLQSIDYVTWGNKQLVWQVTELFFLCFASSGDKLRNIWAKQHEFMDSYVLKMLDLKYVANAQITGIRPQAMTFEYPSGSKRPYHGVQVITNNGAKHMLTQTVEVLRDDNGEAIVFNGRGHRALPPAKAGDVIDVAAGAYCESLIADGWVRILGEAASAAEPVAEPAAESEEPTVESTGEGDDLTKIKWVGEATVADFAAAGITTYKQFSELSIEEVQAVVSLNDTRASEAILSAIKLAGGV